MTATSMPSNVTVPVSPDTPSRWRIIGTQQFTATVVGNGTNTAVTWQVNGVTGGSRTLGFISATGFYVAPGNVPTTSDGSGGSITTTLIVNGSVAGGSYGVGFVDGDDRAGESKSRRAGRSSWGRRAATGTIRISSGGSDHVLRRNAGLIGDARGNAIHFEQQARAGAQRHGGGWRCDRAAGIDRRELRHDAGDDGGESDAVRESGDGESRIASTNIDAAIAQVVSGKVDPTGNILYLGATADANGVPLPARRMRDRACRRR